MENDKVGILNTGNRDLGSDNECHTADMRDIIFRVKTDVLSQIRSVDAKAA